MSRLKWSPMNNPFGTKMRYERANPQHYETPDSEAYREGWERIFGTTRILDSVNQVIWGTGLVPPPGGAAMALREMINAGELAPDHGDEASCPTTSEPS